MDGSNNKASEFERRASRRISRTASVRTTTGHDAHDTDAGDTLLAPNPEDDMSDDAFEEYALAMAALVTDGFRPSQPTDDDTATIPAAAAAADANTNNTNSRDPHTSRPSFSSTASDPFVTDGETLSASSGLPPDSPSSNPSSVVPSTSATSSCAPPPPQTTPQPAAALPPAVAQARSVADRPTSIAKPPSGYTMPTAAGSGSRASRMGSARNSDTASIASSSMPQIEDDEPYQGPSGPSFPYQLYPQNVRMARTGSTSTATPSVALEPEGAYTGPRGPTFPYSMYPQTGMPGLNAVPVAVPGLPGIPVGFSGIPDTYQRRLGPDGEDVADMIGPDGHTEQLPPYSKYPEDAYSRKMAASAGASQPDPLADTQPQMASASSVPPVTAAQTNAVPIAMEMPQTEAEAAMEPLLPPPAQASMPAPPVPAHPHTLLGAIQPVAGAGGLGLAPRNPEYDGEDLESPHSRQSLRSFNSEGSSRELNATYYNEKGRRGRKNALKRLGGRRLLDVVPCWAICLLIAVLVILAVVLGAVLGSFLTKHKKGSNNRRPLGETYPTAVTVTVDATPIPTPSNLPNLPLGAYNLPLEKQAAPAACFNDTNQSSAWSCNLPMMQQMSVTIDVTTPVPNSLQQYTINFACNESLTLSNNVLWYGEQTPTFEAPLALELVGDSAEPNRGPAWFNMVPYNKTVIVQESLLMPTPTSTSAYKRGVHQAFATTAQFDTAANPFAARKSKQMAVAGEKPWVCTWPDTVLEIFIYPNQNVSAPPPFFTSWPTPTAPPPSSAMHSLPPPSAMTPFPTFPPHPPPLMLPPYPRVIKVEERRMADSPQATCVQYEMKSGDSGVYAVPYLDADGNPVQVVITEIESGPALKRGIKELEADASSLSKCGCVWMMT